MDASGRNAIVTLLANLLSERLDEEQLAAAASVITQLGTTLGSWPPSVHWTPRET